MLSAIVRPPRLRTRAEQQTEFHATWLELFFDLVFVVAIQQLAHELQLDRSAHGFLRFAALFVPVWWAWVIYTFYADRFDTDDVPYRLTTLAAMLAILVLGLTIPNAITGDDRGDVAFVVTYLGLRGIVFLLYTRGARYEPAVRRVAAHYITGTTAAALIWVVSLAVEPDGRYALWVVAIAIELSLPMLNASSVRQLPVNAVHIRERFGLFSIIVLGEAVVAVATGLSGTSWTGRTVVTAVAGFALASALWWSYFAFAGSVPDWQTFWTLQIHDYLHLPLVAGLTAIGAGTLIAIEHASSPSLDIGARCALCGGAAAMIASMAVISASLATDQHARAREAARDAVATVLLLLLLLAGAWLPPVVLVAAIVAILATRRIASLTGSS